MGNLPINQRNLRSLTKNSNGTTSVSIPLEYIRALGWYRGKQVAVDLQGKKIVIHAIRSR